jgi:predicted ATPase/DNA-binding SARP family transcriptional activator
MLSPVGGTGGSEPTVLTRPSRSRSSSRRNLLGRRSKLRGYKAVRFGILGPLEVTEDDRLVRVGGSKLRTLLAVLLVHANEVVSADQLGEALWPTSPPDGLLNALQTLMSRLRAIVDPSPGDQRRLISQGTGYLLQVGKDELDAATFESSSQRASSALAAGEWVAASEMAEEALAQWRGRALDEFAHEEFAEARATHLEEQRLLTIECRMDAGLALGRHRELIGDLNELVTHHPLRERLWCQLILGLYRSGRQSEALRAYARIQQRLAEELGINPCAELVRLEAAVLAQDPSLDWTDPTAGLAESPGPDAASGAHDHGREATARPVTFLFTEVENSGALWDRDPAAMGAALRAHDDAVREAIESVRGQVFARPGDGFCAVFDRASDAVTAAIEAQGRLSGTAGTEPLHLQVRMAIHTGDAEPRENTYFGAAVNRTARMRDAGHGGQVLVSAATRELLLDALPAGAGLTDIGTWLFEGLSRPERVYQLDHARLSTGFPPLRSGRPHTARLPRNITSFVGRGQETAWVAGALRESPLVTITGEGGIGKTRLALEVAQRAALTEYPDGVWFCDVSAAVDADGVVEALATALRLVTSVGTDVRTQIVASLQGARLLLLIDNAEGLRADIAELVDQILTSGSEVRILVTSRAPLRTSGEQVFQLAPLEVPDRDATDPAAAPAVRLLIDRARAAGARIDPDDPGLVELARRLDGVPLAIELAAPRLATMSPSELAARLDHRFELLTGSVAFPARQRTLRATIDWSFELLSPDAQRLLAALSVFRGGWTLASAEAVAAAVDLEGDAVALLIVDLAEQSMIRVEPTVQGVARYHMLETMRAYGAEQLAHTGQHAPVAERHAQCFIESAEKAARHRRGPLEPAWVSEIETEFDNLRAAYRWAIESDRPAEGLRLLTALAEDIMRDRLELGRWAEELAAMESARDEPLRAIALAVAGHTAMIELRPDEALRLSLDALEAERLTGSAPSWIPRTTLALMMGLGFADGDYREHLRALEEISRTTGDPLAAAVADFDRCRMASLVGQPTKGLHAAERLLAVGAESRNPTMLAMGLVSHGRAIAPTDPRQAAREFQDALRVAGSVNNTVLAQQALRAIEELNAQSGDRTAALASLRNVAATFEKSGNVTEQLQTVISMLDSLVAIEAWSPLATICGALSQTPWNLSPAARVIEETVAGALDSDDYLAHRRTGQAMSASELFSFVSAFIKEVADDA